MITNSGCRPNQSCQTWQTVLGTDEFFPDPDLVTEAAEALQRATVLVFPERFPEGHLAVVVWSEDYDGLPKEAEQFMLQSNGVVTRIE